MNKSTKAELRSFATDLKAQARRLGFYACGIATATRLDAEARRLESWLHDGHHASMKWMENHFEKRVDPRRLVDGARTVVSVLDNYYQPTAQPSSSSEIGAISRYAWGDDYHLVMKERLALLFEWIRDRSPEVSGRAFVDSAPVLDKVWAERAGLGWIGKHSNLINKHLGSYFFIGELIIDIELEPDGPAVDHCGSCTRCIDACPTDAIFQPYVVDANRCISFLTIENRQDSIPAEIQSDLGNWIFGCDICQDVCPWNKFKQPTGESRYLPRDGVVDTSLETWMELDLDSFREIFRRSPVKRTKYEGFIRNVEVALSNSRNRG